MNELTVFKNRDANLPSYDTEDCKLFSVSSGMSGGMKFIRLDGKEFVMVDGGVKTLIGKTLTGVIVNAGPLSKRFYDKAFTGENTHAPDCASANGETPDTGITTPVCDNCETCPKNAWGSRAGFTGKKAKACQEYRRVIICIKDEDGEHTLYRLDVPAASLNNLRVYGETLTMNRLPMPAVCTRISFDAVATYQRLKFDALKAFPKKIFNDYSAIGQSEEALNMLSMQSSSETDEVVEEEGEEEDDDEVVEIPKTVKKKKVVRKNETVLGPSSENKLKDKPTKKRKKVKKVVEVYEDEEDEDEDDYEDDVAEDAAIVVDSAEELADRLDAELDDDLD